MKSILLFLLLLFFGQLLLAQSFTEVPPVFPFEGIIFGAVAFSDVDGDGDPDVLITGENVSGEGIAKLYTNNGGSFTEVAGTPFAGVRNSSVAFSDVDSDGDEDVLITGRNSSDERVAKLYTNNGGSFTEVVDTHFDGVSSGSIAFSDVDSDGDEDVLITGRNDSGEQIAKLYTNSGGSFTEVAGTPFDGVAGSSVAFADVDGDGDPEVLITGGSSSGNVAKLYTNDGGIFTELVGTPFEGIIFGAVAFSDVDGDGDPDVLITGLDSSSEYIAKLYTNSGGSFTDAADTPFVGVSFGSVAFSDVDGDGDPDVLITGGSSSGDIAKLYTNAGGVFTEVIGPPFEGVRISTAAFSDIDGDGDPDVLIAGGKFLADPIAKLYPNDGGTFIAVAPPFDGVRYSSVAFSDVDGDGNNDALITGWNGSNDHIAKLYTNDGDRFTEGLGIPFDGVRYSSVAFSDVDGDGDNDVLIAGVNDSNERIAKLYINEEGTFTVVDTPFDGVWFGSVAFSDVDGDGDNDLLITGRNDLNEQIATLYTNAGGSFTEVAEPPFEGTENGSVAFSDVDGDGDNDVLITGGSSSGLIAKLYTNAAGSFTEVAGTPFDGVAGSSVAFSDVDGDGDEDVLITGTSGSSGPIAKLYTNAAGSFAEVVGTPFDGVQFGSVAFSDVDNDGDNDLLITGLNGLNERIAKLYTNDGGSFTELTGTPFDGVRYGSVAFSDVDGDGDQDVLITGENGSGKQIAKLYSNDHLTSTINNSASANNFAFTLYPNPTKADILNISFDSGGLGLVNLTVFDLNGRPLRRWQKRAVAGQQTFSIDIASLKKGSYIVQLERGKLRGGRKFLVL